VQLADHRVEPNPGGRGRQVLDRNRPILGIGLQIRALAEGDGPGDHLTVNSHSLILVLRATTRECFHRRAAPATPSGNS
jgi:hypothetical protein